MFARKRFLCCRNSGDWRSARCAIALVLFATVAIGFGLETARAQDYEDVLFEIDYPVEPELFEIHNPVNEEAPPPELFIFVLGDLPELGDGDPRKAVPLAKGEDSTWRVTVRLPANQSYTYQYVVSTRQKVWRAQDLAGMYRIDEVILRDINGSSWGEAVCSNFDAIPIGPVHTGRTGGTASAPSTRKVLYRADVRDVRSPVLHWRQGQQPFETINMKAVDVTDGSWVADGFGEPRRPLEFYITDENEVFRDPQTRFYTTPLDVVFLQDGQLFTYAPETTVRPHRRDYDPADPPVIASEILDELRPYRVLLPRGYDEHSDRRYPVIYMHDGQGAFEEDTTVYPGGEPLDPDGDQIAALMKSGQIREAIVVAVDVLSEDGRFRDYLLPGSSFFGIEGQADKYVRFLIHELKPMIDSKYRTLPDPANTVAIGASLGGLVSVYMGWEFPETFQRVGSWSGSFWTGGLVERAATEPKPDIRIYLDSGEDNLHSTYRLFDALISRPSYPFVVAGDIRYVYSCEDLQHMPEEFRGRLPDVLTFLLPATEAPALSYPDPSRAFRRGDANADGSVDITDAITTLGALFSGNGVILCRDAADSNDDGTVDIADAIATLGYKFGGDGPLPSPGAEICGLDPTDDDLTCRTYPSCDS